MCVAKHIHGPDFLLGNLAYHGVSRFSNCGEWMHTFDLGLLLEAEGSTIDELVFDDETRAMGRAEQRCNALWQDISKVYIKQKTVTRLETLKLSDFHNPQQFCKLAAKAAAARNLLPVLVEVLEDRHTGSERDDNRLRMYKCLNDCYHIIMTGAMFLKEVEWRKLIAQYDKFLLYYNWMCHYSLDHGALRYNFTFKVHAGYHVCEFARFLNPRIIWAYTFEDFMGKIARSAQASTAGTPLVLVAEKTVENFMRAKYLRQKRRRDGLF